MVPFMVLYMVLLILSPVLIFLGALIIFFFILTVSMLYGCYFGQHDWTKYGLPTFIENDKIKVIDHCLDPLGWDDTIVDYIIHIPNEEDSCNFFQQAIRTGGCKPWTSPLSIGEQMVWRLRTGQGLSGVWYRGDTDLNIGKGRKYVIYYIYKGENNIFYVKCVRQR